MKVKDILSESAGLYRRQLDETKGLVDKWKKTGLLKGLPAEYDQHGMAIILENQAKQLVTEANATGTAANNGKYNQSAAGYMYNLNKYVQLRGVYAHYTTKTESTTTTTTDGLPFKNTADIFSVGTLVTF